MRFRLWPKIASGTGTVGLFLGSTQVVGPIGSPVELAFVNTTYDRVIASLPSSNGGIGASGGAAADVATGQLADNGDLAIYAAAGTHTVSLRFKSSAGGSVSVKDRKLWVWTQAFG